MSQYIIEFAKELRQILQDESRQTISGLSTFVLFSEILEGLQTLQVRQFPPDQQSKFIAVKNTISKIVQQGVYQDDQATKAIPNKVIEMVSLYPPDLLPPSSSPAPTFSGRDFNFLSDPALRTIVERDYQELRGILFPHGAWKSTVILAGSILEAILFDRLSDPLNFVAATSHSSAPKANGVVKDLVAGDWKLIELIRVASAIGVLPAAKSNTIDQVLRDYRNFVHPKKEIRAQHTCTEAEAQMAVGALDAVYNHFNSP